jgi:hypothetical protein
MKASHLFTVSAILALITLTGCSGSGSGDPLLDVKYIAVQVDKGDPWSIIDEDGDIIVKEEYGADDKISKIYDDIFWVKSGDKYQLFNVDSPKKPISDEWDYATSFHSGRALVANAGEPINIIDEDGKIVTTLSKDIVEIKREDSAGFSFKKSDGTYGWADENGKIVKEGLCEHADLEGGDIVVIRTKEDSDRYDIYDAKGNKTGSFTADVLFASSNGYISISKGDKQILLDKNGETVIESKKYVTILPPLYGKCITIGSSWDLGLIDLDGEVIIRPKYSFLRPIDSDLLIASKEGEIGLIDENDETVVDFEYDDITTIGDHFLVKDGSAYIIIDRKGEQIGKQEFYDYCSNSCDTEIRYTDVKGLAKIVKAIGPEYDEEKTVSQVADMLGLSPSDEYERSYKFTTTKNIEGYKATINYIFNARGMYGLSEERFHQETKNDGWFDYEEDVSDGWFWNEFHNLTAITIEIPIEGDASETADILLSYLLKNGYKEPEGDVTDERVAIGNNYSLYIDTNGNGLEIRFN